MRIESQNSKVLRWLESGKSLSPLDALQRFGVFRLAARVHALKQLGYRIKAERTVFTNGRRCSTYRLQAR